MGVVSSGEYVGGGVVERGGKSSQPHKTEVKLPLSGAEAVVDPTWPTVKWHRTYRGTRVASIHPLKNRGAKKTKVGGTMRGGSVYVTDQEGGRG